MGLKSTSHTKDLKEQGYSDKEVIDKLFTLEIDAWNILLDK